MISCLQCPNAAVLPEVQYMDKLFEDGIKLFCVDVVLNHFDCLKVVQVKLTRFAIP